MFPLRVVLLSLASLTLLAAQDVRPRDVREIAKGGSPAIPKLQELLKNPSADVRAETVRQLTEIGSARSLDPLMLATRDNDAEVQILATDGLVNFYVPGYVKTGMGARLRRVGTGLKSLFTDTNDQVIDAYVVVRPEVITALARLANGGGNMEARANAARALGILRGGAAVAELVEAVHSKDTDVIYESLVALEKIRDESAGPRVEFRLHDLDPKVQTAAIETVGLLRDKGAAPDLIDVLNHARDIKVKRAALTSLAMLPGDKSRGVYAQYLGDKDDKMRAAAAEGLGRLRDPADLDTLEKSWKDEGKIPPRLGLAFALVLHGQNALSEFSPLQLLVNNLDSAAYSGVASAYLVELARDSVIRDALVSTLPNATKDEKIGLAGVLARSGDEQSVASLQKLSNDTDTDVAQAGLRALRILRARL